jgi:hypothetical protein
MYIKKISILFIIALFLSSVAFGALTTTEVTPSTLPKGAYVNQADGDQYFWQNIRLVSDGNGDIDDANIDIDLPAGVYIADVDEQGDYVDEIAITGFDAGGADFGPTVDVGNTDQTTISIDIGTLAQFDNGADEIYISFPVETDANPSGTEYTVTTQVTGTATEDNIAVTFVDHLSLFDFDATHFADTDNKQESDAKGKYHPNEVGQNVLATNTADLVEEGDANITDVSSDLIDYAGATVYANGDGDNNNETTYYLWASQEDSLTQVYARPGVRQIQIVDDGNDDGAWDIAEGTAVEATDFLTGDENGLFPISIDGTSTDEKILTRDLEEGNWFFYITSNHTSDWALAKSDTVEITHKPVFHAEDHATYPGLVNDFDDDGLFEPGGDDDVDDIYLDSGGGLGRDGILGGTNQDHVKISWNLEDVDHNASVKLYLLPQDSVANEDAAWDLADNNNLSELTAKAKQIGLNDFYEEDDTTWYDYDIDPGDDASNIEPAGDFYLFAVAEDDNGNVDVHIDQKADATSEIEFYVKHFPQLAFQDVDGGVDEMYDPSDGGTANEIDLNTNEDKYLVINWGETINGDKDSDGNMTIKLYAALEQQDNNDNDFGGSGIDYSSSGTDIGYSTDVTAVDTSALADAAAGSPAYCKHIATIVDSTDTKADNRYMWNFRDAGFSDGDQFNIFAVVTEKGDAQIVAYDDADGATWNNAVGSYTFNIGHGTYFQSVTPVEDQKVRLDGSDRYEFKWDCFDKGDADGIPGAIAMVPAGTDITITGTGDIEGTAGYHWLSSTDGDDVSNISDVTSTSSYVVDFGTIVEDAAGNNADSDAPQGDYDVYYIYDGADDGDLTDADNIAVKADGQIHINRYDAPATDFEMSPNRVVAEKGDTLSLDVYLTGTAANEHSLEITMRYPDSKMEVVDQNDSEPGVQAFSDNANFDGTIYSNDVIGSGEYDTLNYVVLDDDDSEDIGGATAVATIQLAITAQNWENDLENVNVEFIHDSDEDYRTRCYDDAGNELAASFPEVAANVQLGTPGKIEGDIDIQARPDEGEVVSIFVSPEGSVEQLDDSEFLAANNDDDASDGIQDTLSAGGNYTIEGVPSGTYDITVAKDGWISQRIKSQTVNNLSTTTVNFTGDNKLLAGDCAGYAPVGGGSVPDNQITSGDDGQAIQDAYGTTPSDESWNVYADFNNDSLINLEDMNYEQVNSGVNSGNGEGLLYKRTQSNNNNAVVSIEETDVAANKVTYTVKASKITDLRAYSVKMDIDPAKYKIVSYEDNFIKQKKTYNFYKYVKGNVYFTSALEGRNTIASSELELFRVTLEKKDPEADAPKMYSASLIGADNKAVDASLADELIPDDFALERNYPNPFNPTTNIKFAMPKAGNVKLTIYNMLGQKVRTLVSNKMEAGRYNVQWNARNDYGARVASGLYFYKMQVNGKHIGSRKMILMK